MLRNEALLLLPPMLGGNADLQKIVAFSGAFERLFEIIQQEGGSDGGIVVQDAMTVVGGLLRFNVSNQVSDWSTVVASAHDTSRGGGTDGRTTSENCH